jgi:hypothetical protein
MRIIETYSHLNGEEYLIVHHPALYKEITSIIDELDATKHMTKTSREKTMLGKKLFNPKAINADFRQRFNRRGWNESRYRYYVTTNKKHLQEIMNLPLREQREYLLSKGIQDPILSYKQTDFVKDRIAVEVQFGKYAFVAYDLFVKHLLFFTGDIINVGIEILPVKAMARDTKGGRRLSTGIAYYEGEVYNVLRHGRNSPPVPLLIIGVA